MAWGFFTVSHIISLVFTVAAVFILHFALKGRSTKTQTLVLFSLSLWGVASIIFNLLYWGAPLENLPLHLCAAHCGADKEQDLGQYAAGVVPWRCGGAGAEQ